MICTPAETLQRRARALTEALATAAPKLTARIVESVAYLGSGSLPTEAIPSLVVTVSAPGLSAAELARRLRLDAACVFGRIEADLVRLDLRTITDEQVPAIAAALGRITAEP
jgi:L-seryl-tRNA(Ser) seleniumtransferase